MAQDEPKMHETERHHFLFHIFRMDKAENPMPQRRAKTLLQHLKRVFADNPENNKGRK